MLVEVADYWLTNHCSKPADCSFHYTCHALPGSGSTLAGYSRLRINCMRCEKMMLSQSGFNQLNAHNARALRTFLTQVTKTSQETHTSNERSDARKNAAQ